MNFFNNDNQGPTAMTMAKTETEILTDMFNKMSGMCFKKCITKYVDTELAVGEMTCVDRCVGKYMMAQQRVGDVLNDFEKQMKAKDAAIAQQQQKFQ